jgi:hypothetical protein
MPAPKTPNTSAATEASVAARRRAKHERMAHELRQDENYLVLSREQVTEMLADPAYPDGLTPAWLRGYLKIPNP